MVGSLRVRPIDRADAQAYHALRKRSTEGLAHAIEPQVLQELEAGAEGIAAHVAEYVANGIQAWGAFDGDALIGAAALSREYHHSCGGIGVLWGVFVMPRYRGTPVSRLLMDAIVGYCGIDCTIHQILAPCARDNVAGRRFLQRFGFEPMTLVVRDGPIHDHGGTFIHLRRPVA